MQPGLHFLIPIIERRAAEVNLRTQEARYSLNGKTKDNVTIGTAVSVQFRVDQMPAQTVEQSGVYRSYYILSNPIDQMESYIADALRSAIPGYTLDEVFDNKDLIAQNVKDSVTELMAGYGYDIITTLITDIELPKDVERSMNAINSAQRDQEAAKALAEAERTKTVVAARAQADGQLEPDGHRHREPAQGHRRRHRRIARRDQVLRRVREGGERPVHVHSMGGDDGVVRRIRQGLDHPAPVRLRGFLLDPPGHPCSASRPAETRGRRQPVRGLSQTRLRSAQGPPKCTAAHMRIVNKREGVGPGVFPGPTPSRLCLYRSHSGLAPAPRLGASANNLTP